MFYLLSINYISVFLFYYYHYYSHHFKPNSAGPHPMWDWQPINKFKLTKEKFKQFKLNIFLYVCRGFKSPLSLNRFRYLQKKKKKMLRLLWTKHVNNEEVLTKNRNREIDTNNQNMTVDS